MIKLNIDEQTGKLVAERHSHSLSLSLSSDWPLASSLADRFRRVSFQTRIGFADRVGD